MNWKRGYLTIAAERGFNDDFLNFFRHVKAEHGSACARAIRNRRSIVIEDVLLDREFAPCRRIVMDAGVRAVQSTPLISSRGAFLGVLSTHFTATHRPSEREMQAVKMVAELTANEIIRLRAAKNLGEQIREAVEAIKSSDLLLATINRRQKRDGWLGGSRSERGLRDVLRPCGAGLSRRNG